MPMNPYVGYYQNIRYQQEDKLARKTRLAVKLIPGVYAISTTNNFSRKLCHILFTAGVYLCVNDLEAGIDLFIKARRDIFKKTNAILEVTVGHPLFRRGIFVLSIRGGARFINISEIASTFRLEMNVQPFIKIAQKYQSRILGNTVIRIMITWTPNTRRTIFRQYLPLNQQNDELGRLGLGLQVHLIG